MHWVWLTTFLNERVIWVNLDKCYKLTRLTDSNGTTYTEISIKGWAGVDDSVWEKVLETPEQILLKAYSGVEIK